MSYYMPRQGVSGLVHKGHHQGVHGLGRVRFARRAHDGFGYALGASFTFNAGQVWSDWKAGGSAGNNAAKQIQAALNEIGYGPLVVDGDFGAGSVAAWTRFVGDNSPLTGSWPDQPGIDKLGEKLNVGGNQGGGGVIQEHVDAGTIVSGADPNAGGVTGLLKGKLSTGAMIGIGAAVLLGIGALALMSKKKTSSTTATGKPVLHPASSAMTTTKAA